MKENNMTPDPQTPAPANADSGSAVPPPPAAGGMTVPPPPRAEPLNSSSAQTAPYRPEPYRTAPEPVSHRRNYALFAGAGLVVGLGAGLLFAQIDLSSEPEPSMALTEAVRGCGLTEQAGIELGDEGQSLTMDTEGYDDYLGGDEADDAQVDCVLRALSMPDSVNSRMGNTRALDGRQSAEWGEFTASWSYHPDSGTNVVIEIVKPRED
ncbi:hypothetical protein [Arthrobacter sp. YD2]|uniref:hypothetical protein n=1 Tax=Arthrobacter sp. YD2 TaxID=3058046 RepID=UPI0025B55141|nr:hypothetical protein [Arthrobacter sp. YD2]MDN3903438.1 hypothetical protein [Arthrobacter sp. YD2]